MVRILRIILGALVALAACAAFFVAAIIQTQPQVPVAPPPVARDVRAVVWLSDIGLQIVNVPIPVSNRITRDMLEGAHRLVGHAKSNLRADVLLSNQSATFRLSRRMMPHGWLNLQFRLVENANGPPRIQLFAGPWKAPDWVPAILVKTAVRAFRDRPDAFDGLSSLIPRFAVDPNGISLDARVPKPLFGAAQMLFSSGSRSLVDMNHVRSIYGDLLAYRLLNPQVDYPAMVRRAMQGVDDREGLDAAVIALTMFVDGQRVRRLAGDRTVKAPCQLGAQPVPIWGREDTPKHWTLSAALALTMDVKPARAIGLWKELDDSLPGGDGLAQGSGFSFVDLAADMGGIRVGAAARSGEDVKEVIAILRSADAATLFPPVILRIADGMPTGEFERRFGGLEQPKMLQAERDLRTMLAVSPLYRRSSKP